jgi:hypothetical protein
MLVAGLHGLQQPRKPGDKAAVALRVIGHCAQDAPGINEQGGAHRLRASGTGMHHAVCTGQVHLDVLDDRKADLDTKLFLGDLCPGQLLLQAVDRPAQQPAVHAARGVGVL